MPRAKNKIAKKSKSGPVGQVEKNSTKPAIPASGSPSSAAKSGQVKPAPRKRGWRDIEAISERARLKKMLADIWHEDIELDEDIFGDSDHLQGYYSDMGNDEIAEEIIGEIDDEIDEEPEEFDEEKE